ncbi:MAG: hypothetical protein LBD38_05530 [Streptococcaceae bacterium]|nr:hypothetical protein [Streptococcaceae bacterium]
MNTAQQIDDLHIEKHIENKQFEILQSQETVRLKIEQEDLLFFSFYGLGGIFMVLTMFTLYQILTEKLNQQVIQSAFILASLLAASVVIGFILSRLVIAIAKKTWQFQRKHTWRRYHNLPEKITSIEVDHYDFVKIERPEGMTDTQAIRFDEILEAEAQQFTATKNA